MEVRQSRKMTGGAAEAVKQKEWDKLCYLKNVVQLLSLTAPSHPGCWVSDAALQHNGPFPCRCKARTTAAELFSSADARAGGKISCDLPSRVRDTQSTTHRHTHTHTHTLHTYAMLSLSMWHKSPICIILRQKISVSGSQVGEVCTTSCCESQLPTLYFYCIGSMHCLYDDSIISAFHAKLSGKL